MKTIHYIVEQYAHDRTIAGRKPLIGNGLKYFLNWVAKNYPDERYFKQSMIDVWMHHRDTESAIAYQSRYYSVASFLRFAREREYTSVMEPPPPIPAKSSYRPHIFTSEELKNFFRACDEYKFEKYVFIKTLERHNLMALVAPIFYRLMYSSGLRPPEVRCLLRSDVNMSTGVAIIHNTKGYNEHKVVLHDTMLELIKSYDDDMNKIMPNRKYMFPDENDEPYSTASQNRLFYRLWHKYNDTKCVAYCFRHNYAITNINRLLERGVEANEDLMALCKSMGHASFQETMHYYSLVPNFGKILDNLCDEELNDLLPKLPQNEEK